MQSQTIIVPPEGKFAPSNRKHQGIPGIEILPTGRLFACYYANTENYEGPGNYVVVSSSTNGGLSWREIAVFAPTEKNLRNFDPVIWRAPDGVLRLFYSQNRSMEAWDVFDGRNGVWVSECINPDDETPQWSEPRRIGDGTMMNKPTVTHDGSYLAPAALWQTWPEKMLPEMSGKYRANILRSNDSGQSWEFIAGADVPQRHFDEHVIIERKDHSWWMLVRTLYGIGQSFSYDSGQSWSDGEDSGLGGPCSRFALRRLRSGKLCLINHITPLVLPGDKRFPRKREKLSAWLSDDDGQSWYGGLIINPDEDISYPDFTEGNDGFIYMIYDRGRTVHGQILMARFTEKDIAEAAFLTPGSTGGLLVASFGY